MFTVSVRFTPFPFLFRYKIRMFFKCHNVCFCVILLSSVYQWHFMAQWFLPLLNYAYAFVVFAAHLYYPVFHSGQYWPKRFLAPKPCMSAFSLIHGNTLSANNLFIFTTNVPDETSGCVLQSSVTSDLRNAICLQRAAVVSFGTFIRIKFAERIISFRFPVFFSSCFSALRLSGYILLFFLFLVSFLLSI